MLGVRAGEGPGEVKSIAVDAEDPRRVDLDDSPSGGPGPGIGP